MGRAQEVFNERSMLMKIKHPNIVRLHQSFQDASNLYLVLDYAVNGTFSQMLALNQRLSFRVG